MLMQGMAGGFGGPGGGGPGGFGGFGGGGEGGGGRGSRGGGGGQSRRETANRIGIGVDARTNTLVVSATDPVFNEIRELVHEMDVAAAAENETVSVVRLHRTSSAAIEQALTAYAGNAVQAVGATSSTTQSSTNRQPWWQRHKPALERGGRQRIRRIRRIRRRSGRLRRLRRRTRRLRRRGVAADAAATAAVAVVAADAAATGRWWRRRTRWTRRRWLIQSVAG